MCPDAACLSIPHHPAASAGLGTGAWVTLSGSLRPAPHMSLTRHNLAWCCWYLREPCWEVSEQLCLVGLLLEKALFGCTVRRGGIWEVRPHCCRTLGAWPHLSPMGHRADAWGIIPTEIRACLFSRPEAAPSQVQPVAAEPGLGEGGEARRELGKNERETPASAPHLGSWC